MEWFKYVQRTALTSLLLCAACAHLPAPTTSPQKLEKRPPITLAEKIEPELIGDDESLGSLNNVPAPFLKEPETPVETEELPKAVVTPPRLFETPNVTAKEALLALTKGNERFLKHRTSPKKKSVNRPIAIVLSCSDSGTAPEVSFDQNVGEIYVVKTAAESVDASALGSIELAIQLYDIRLIYVLGHNHCSAINDALNIPAGSTTQSEALDRLFEDIRSHLKYRHLSPERSLGLVDEATENARGVAESLVERSAVISKLVSNGVLKIKTGLLRQETGAIEGF